jgi:AcrR family transcriptional regulator
MESTRLQQTNEQDVERNVDGRALRRTRNRTAVIVALLELIREGNLDPSTGDIAERAGVSDRSIFRYFDDLDDLVRTTIGHAIAEAEVYGAVEDVGVGTLEERIDHFVDARIRLFSKMDGPMRVARIRSYTIPSIDTELSAILEITRRLVRTQFAPELHAHPLPERDHLADAVMVLAGYDAYSVHTRLLNQSQDEMRASMTTALTALLTAPSS